MTLRDMFENHSGPETKKRALNALSFPNYSSTTKDEKLNMIERIWNASNFIYGFKKCLFPGNSFFWHIIGLCGAMHDWHNDSEGLGTFIIILSGLKWWCIGRNIKTREKLDFFLETPGADAWLVDEDWDVEAILLEPGTRMYVG